MDRVDQGQLLKKSSKTLNEEFKDLIKIVVEAVPEFRFYDVNRMVISIGASRSKGPGGIYAHIVPLRYQGGSYYRRGKRWGQQGLFFYDSPQIVRDNPEALYMVTFMLPKFFRVKAQERLETIVHELYHIHPNFRGDLRKFSPPHVHHGPTPKKFQKKVEELTETALKEMPFLLQHPLLSEDVKLIQEKKRKRYNMPQLKFVPQSTLFSFLLLAFSLLSFWVPNAQANVPVQVKSSAYLRALPQDNAAPSTQVVSGERMRALKQSPDRQWIFISNGSKGGWIKKEDIQMSAPSYNDTIRRSGGVGPSNGEPDSFFSDEIEKEFGGDFENKLDSDLGYDKEALPDEDFSDEVKEMEEGAAFVANQDGKLYENPSKFANRFSRIEKGDSLQFVRKSQSGKWTYVRLSITGEEGWVPSQWLTAEKKEVSSSIYDDNLHHNLDLKLAFGPQPYGFGGSAGYYYTIWNGGEKDAPSRFDIGLQLHWYMGSTLELNGQELKTRYFSTSFTGRYIPTLKGGKYFLVFEAGGIYHTASIQTNLAKETVENSDLGVKETDIQALFGGAAGMNFSNGWYGQAGAQLFLKSSYSLFGYAGVGKRF